jgi:hypothetical protein
MKKTNFLLFFQPCVRTKKNANYIEITRAFPNHESDPVSRTRSWPVGCRLTGTNSFPKHKLVPETQTRSLAQPRLHPEPRVPSASLSRANKKRLPASACTAGFGTSEATRSPEGSIGWLLRAHVAKTGFAVRGRATGCHFVVNNWFGVLRPIRAALPLQGAHGTVARSCDLSVDSCSIKWG